MTKIRILMLKLTDLTEISRGSKYCSTTVSVELEPYEPLAEWLRFGQANLKYVNDRKDGRWCLESYLANGATDFEHDSAYALRLPLIGVQFDSIPVWNHMTRLVAWVDPSDYLIDRHSDFRVPSNDYNPLKLSETTICEMKGCDKHPIVPEGFYLPPFNEDLFLAVRGKKVEIHIGTVLPKNNENINV